MFTIVATAVKTLGKCMVLFMEYVLEHAGE